MINVGRYLNPLWLRFGRARDSRTSNGRDHSVQTKPKVTRGVARMATEVERSTGAEQQGKQGDGGEAGESQRPSDRHGPASKKKMRSSTPDLERKAELLRARTKSSDKLRAIRMHVDETIEAMEKS